MIEVKTCGGKTECRMKGKFEDISADTIHILSTIIEGLRKDGEEYADDFKKILPEIIALALLEHSEIRRLADAMRCSREEGKG